MNETNPRSGPSGDEGRPGDRGQPLRTSIRGKGEPPILLLHGFTGSPEAWGDALLDGLARRRKVLAVELPGHHRRGSDPEPSLSRNPERYRLGRVLADLLATLDSQGHQRADWLGYSMGGRVALAGAVVHPRRVRRLVLEGASPGLHAPEERRLRRESDEELAQLLDAEGMDGFIRRWLEQPLFATQKRLTPEVRRQGLDLRRERDPDALAAVLRGLGTGSQPSFWNRLGEVSAPTLLLTGALDEKFEALAEWMEEGILQAERCSVPETGHAVHLEAPDAWLRAVDGFLSR